MVQKLYEWDANQKKRLGRFQKNQDFHGIIVFSLEPLSARK
jgi:hypothetical protein